MNSKAFQCLSCRLKQSAGRSVSNGRRLAHTSESPSKTPAYPHVRKAADETLQARREQIKELSKNIKGYTERELELLALRYTPEQMEAIKAGESAINPEDMVTHGRIRGDAFRPQYLDDFAKIRPLVDRAPTRTKPVRNAEDRESADEERRSIPGGLSSQAVADEDPHLVRLGKQTGLSAYQIRKIRVKNLVTHRVVNQTRMGKIQSIYYLTIAGNEDGMVGIGEGKAVEFEDARRQSVMNAIRNMKPIPRYENRTIYGEVEAKVGASIVQISSRPPGFGNRCQHLIFELTRAAGISDLAARTPRSRNKMNVVKAAFKALTSQRLPEDIARSRGRKMVDVRNVYYGGQVH